MANPPSSMALKPASAPESLPMGVRAPAMMTEPGMDVTSDGTVSAGRGRLVGGPPFYGSARALRRVDGVPSSLGTVPGPGVGCLPMQAFREAILTGAGG